SVSALHAQRITPHPRSRRTPVHSARPSRGARLRAAAPAHHRAIWPLSPPQRHPRPPIHTQRDRVPGRARIIVLTHRGSEMSNLDVVGLCGSLRKESVNHMVLKLAGDSMPAGMELEILDWREVPVFDADVL